MEDQSHYQVETTLALVESAVVQSWTQQESHLAPAFLEGTQSALQSLAQSMAAQSTVGELRSVLTWALGSGEVLLLSAALSKQKQQEVQ